MRLRVTLDIPLAGDAAARFLPWLFGFMVYLAALALALTLLVVGAGERWRAAASGTATVQIAPIADDAEDTRDQRVATVMEILRATPGIAAAQPLSEDQMLALLRPWLGSGADAGALPLPRVIDVAFNADSRPDTAALADRLAAVPGVTLDDHGAWLGKLAGLAHTVERIALGTLALIFAATIATIVFTTRTSLEIHREVVEVLHLIGARDGYIARQFELQALIHGLKGGIGGLALAAATLIMISTTAMQIDAPLLPRLSLSTAEWIAVACVPLFAAATAMIAARVTVLRALARQL
jgi:cell division transport system permease protein